MRYIGNAPLFVYDPTHDKIITKEEYRQTEYHKQLKSERAFFAEWHCEICGAFEPSGDFHHIHYDTFGFRENVFTDGLYLCRKCHQAIHETDRKEYGLRYRCKELDYQNAKDQQRLFHFYEYFEPLEMVNGGDINLCDQKQIKKYYGGYNILEIQNHFTKLKWKEIDNMVISGYVAENSNSTGWWILPQIIGVSKGNVKTYRRNLYERKAHNWIETKITIGGNRMKELDLTNVKESGNSTRIPAGGYICKFTKVEDREEKEYLYMEFDVIEGEFKGYYADLEDRYNYWGGKVFRSYKEKALPMFKRMCSAVNKSNPGFVFDGGKQNKDEKTLVGKKIGIILGEEEYEGNDGTVRTRTYVYSECPIDDIKKGNYKVPQKKCLPKVEDVPNFNNFLNVDDTKCEGVPW